MSKTLVELITFLTITQICHSIPFAAEAKQPAGWDKILEPAKKEGKIVIAIPPARCAENGNRCSAKLGREAELAPNPGQITLKANKPKPEFQPGSLQRPLSDNFPPKHSESC